MRSTLHSSNEEDQTLPPVRTLSVHCVAYARHRRGEGIPDASDGPEHYNFVARCCSNRSHVFSGVTPIINWPMKEHRTNKSALKSSERRPSHYRLRRTQIYSHLFKLCVRTGYERRFLLFFNEKELIQLNPPPGGYSSLLFSLHSRWLWLSPVYGNEY